MESSLFSRSFFFVLYSFWRFLFPQYQATPSHGDTYQVSIDDIKNILQTVTLQIPVGRVFAPFPSFPFETL